MFQDPKEQGLKYFGKLPLTLPVLAEAEWNISFAVGWRRTLYVIRTGYLPFLRINFASLKWNNTYMVLLQKLNHLHNLYIKLPILYHHYYFSINIITIIRLFLSKRTMTLLYFPILSVLKNLKNSVYSTQYTHMHTYTQSFFQEAFSELYPTRIFSFLNMLVL